MYSDIWHTLECTIHDFLNEAKSLVLVQTHVCVDHFQLFRIFIKLELCVGMRQIQLGKPFSSGQLMGQIFNYWNGVSVLLDMRVNRDFIITRCSHSVVRLEEWNYWRSPFRTLYLLGDAVLFKSI